MVLEGVERRSKTNTTHDLSELIAYWKERSPKEREAMMIAPSEWREPDFREGK